VKTVFERSFPPDLAWGPYHASPDHLVNLGFLYTIKFSAFLYPCENGWWGVGDVSLNVNFALNEPRLGAAAVLSQNLTNTVFAAQLLQWNIKLLTVFLN